jgi:type I restriction enzyme R subunit
MDTDTGPADYMLFIDGKACGALEAKREGKNLGEVYRQSHRYTVSKTKNLQRWADVLPFTYEATNIEIRFCDQRDPYPRGTGFGSSRQGCESWRVKVPCMFNSDSKTEFY